jgi:hypothetical protein
MSTAKSSALSQTARSSALSQTANGDGQEDARSKRTGSKRGAESDGRSDGRSGDARSEGRAHKGRKKHKNKEIDESRLQLVQQKLSPDGFYSDYKMFNSVPSALTEPVRGKLLGENLRKDAFCEFPLPKAKPSANKLDVEFPYPLLFEHDHGLKFDALSPEVAEIEVDMQSVAGTNLTGPPEKKDKDIIHTSVYLRKSSLISNDLFSQGNNFLLGHDAAEKRLDRTAQEPVTLEGAKDIIVKTFEDAQRPPQHPTKIGMRPVVVRDVLPYTEHMARSFVQCTFDVDPTQEKTPVPIALLPSEDELLRNAEKPTYFAFAGKNQELKEAQETLRSDPEEKIELPRAYVYVWNNKLANNAIVEKMGETGVSELVIAKPKRELDNGEAPILYLPLRGMLQRHSLSMAAGFQPVPNNADAVIRARAMHPEEHERDSRMRKLLTAGAAAEQLQLRESRIEEAKKYADEIAAQAEAAQAGEEDRLSHDDDDDDDLV